MAVDVERINSELMKPENEPIRWLLGKVLLNAGDNRLSDDLVTGGAGIAAHWNEVIINFRSLLVEPSAAVGKIASEITALIMPAHIESLLLRPYQLTNGCRLASCCSLMQTQRIRFPRQGLMKRGARFRVRRPRLPFGPNSGEIRILGVLAGYRHFSAQAKAIFHQRTRVWTTHGVGKSESMDARTFPVPNPRISAARKPVRRFGRFSSKWQCQCGCRMLGDSTGTGRLSCAPGSARTLWPYLDQI